MAGCRPFGGAPQVGVRAAAAADPEWLAQRDLLVQECTRAIDVFVKKWDALQRHANWDRRQGQPFVVECKNGRFTLPKWFKSRVTGVGPSAKDEDEDEDEDKDEDEDEDE